MRAGISCAVSDDAPLEACVVLWGVCNHAFHSHCVTKFLKTSKDMCVDDKLSRHMRIRYVYARCRRCPLGGDQFVVARSGR